MSLASARTPSPSRPAKLLAHQATLAVFRVDAGRVDVFTRRIPRERESFAGNAAAARALAVEEVSAGKGAVVFAEGVRGTRTARTSLLKTAGKWQQEGEPPNARKGSEESHRFAV